jgi:hypothetical protein
LILQHHFQNRRTRILNDVEQGKEPSGLDIRSELGQDSSDDEDQKPIDAWRKMFDDENNASKS